MKMRLKFNCLPSMVPALTDTPPYLSARILALLALVAGLAIFVVLSVWVTGGYTEIIDERIFLGLRDPLELAGTGRSLWLRETAADLTALGGYPVLVFAGFLILVALLVAGERRAALFLILTLTSGSAVSSGLKLWFDRPRPDLVDHLDQTFTSSFPSAHAMVSMVGWIAFAMISSRFLSQAALRRFVFGAALCIALIIGITRIYLGVHWPSDVLAGWAAGLAWVSLCWLIADRWSWRHGT